MPTKLLLTLLLASTPLLADEPLKAQMKPEQKLRSITGTVQDAEGNPVVAEIWIHWANAKSELLVSSKADGTFAATLPFGKGEFNNGGQLVARAKGHGSDFRYHGTKYDPESLNPKATITFKLPKERKLTGRVIDTENRAVAGVKVSAREISSFASEAEADRKLLAWAKEGNLFGPPPNMYRVSFNDGRDNIPHLSFLLSPFTATTDADGEFEITGLGANQQVSLFVRGTGMADQELFTLNRDGFDYFPLVELVEARIRKEKWIYGQWKPRSSNPLIVMDKEKILRGIVKDDSGKAQPDVRVSFARTAPSDISERVYTAITDKDGKYEMRGVRKHKAYMLEVPSNNTTGTMQCQIFTNDTKGYDPLTIDIFCKRGIIITGRITNKVTGEAIAKADVRIEPLKSNPFVKQYPEMKNSMFGSATSVRTDKDGNFRVVTIPGPVVLIVRSYVNEESEFIPPVPDPDFPNYFTVRDTSLLFDSLKGPQHLNGDWCKVLEPKVTDTELTVNIEMVPARKTLVKVTDYEGQPLLGTKATGISHIEFHSPRDFVDTSTITVLNLEPKKDRLLVVYHEKTKLVGSLMLNADTKDPVVKLDYGGTIHGRAVDKDGKPLVGLKVSAKFEHRQATEAFLGFHKNELPVTDANGQFRLSGLMPGLECKLYYKLDGRSYGLEKLPTPVYQIKKAGEFVKTGDMILLIDHE